MWLRKLPNSIGTGDIHGAAVAARGTVLKSDVK